VEQHIPGYRFHMNQIAREFRPTQASLPCTALVLVLSLVLSPKLVLGEKPAPVERTYDLPCEVTSFDQSGDGSIVWFACKDRSLWKRWQSDAAEAGKQKKLPPPPPVTVYSRTEVYAIEISSGRITALGGAEGRVEIVAAPLGTRMVLVLPEDKGPGRPVLYDGTRKVTELPIDPSRLLLWSPDARKIYFYGGSTIEAEAWDILGVLQLDGLVVIREKLLEATESFHICTGNGHIFTGDPIPNEKGDLEANTVEYDPDLKSPQRITKFLPGVFSASCRYVATEQSFHGPLPGEIIDVATGQRLMRFEFTGEGKKVEFEFQSWNPKRDDIFLRLVDLPMNSETGLSNGLVQVFQLGKQRVLESFNDISGNVAWSRDGRSLVFPRANSLVFRLIFK
jgi:hypothetical protein